MSECYYFGADGNILTGTTTPDGYQVNADGAWVSDGAVQTNRTGGLSSTELCDALSTKFYVIDNSRPETRSGISNVRLNDRNVSLYEGHLEGWRWMECVAEPGLAAQAYDKDGFVYVNTTTPDGYHVDEYGYLTINGERVVHAGGCQGFISWADVYDKNGVKFEDKNDIDISRFNSDVAFRSLVSFDYANANYMSGYSIPFGSLVYAHYLGTLTNREHPYRDCLGEAYIRK